jgi:hypothetical protein
MEKRTDNGKGAEKSMAGKVRMVLAYLVLRDPSLLSG